MTSTPKTIEELDEMRAAFFRLQGRQTLGDPRCLLLSSKICKADAAAGLDPFALRDRIEKLEGALRLLIPHAIDCEKRLDEFHGLGSDAGQGYSIVVCEARAALENRHD